MKGVFVYDERFLFVIEFMEQGRIEAACKLYYVIPLEQTEETGVSQALPGS